MWYVKNINVTMHYDTFEAVKSNFKLPVAENSNDEDFKKYAAEIESYNEDVSTATCPEHLAEAINWSRVPYWLMGSRPDWKVGWENE